MARYVVIILLAIFMVGCGNQPVKLRTEVQEVFKPILYCPAPNWDELEQPLLLIDQITPTMPPGEVAKRYKASVLQLEDYSDRLRRALDRYDATNEAYEGLRQQFMQQRKEDGIEIPID